MPCHVVSEEYADFPEGGMYVVTLTQPFRLSQTCCDRLYDRIAPCLMASTVLADYDAQADRFTCRYWSGKLGPIFGLDFA